MKFVFPIEGKEAEDLYALNHKGAGGFYPIGMNNAYHGGTHFEGKHAVVAICDGTVVSYRYMKKYCEETKGDKLYKYTNCFIIVRHEYETPKGQKLTFFSLFNQICPWEEFNEEQKKRRPSIFTSPGYKITASALNVRSTMDSSSDKNLIAKSRLTKGDEVIASAVDDKWAKKEGVEEYFVYKGYSEAVSITSDPHLDEIVSVSIPVKAGTLLGYCGMYDQSGVPENYYAVHVEVFAGDDTVPFVQNSKKDGEKKPTMLQIATETVLKSKEKKYPDTNSIPKATLKAETTVTILDKESDPQWVCVEEIDMVRSVKRDWMIYHNDKSKKGDEHYTPKKEHLADMAKAFDNLEISLTSKFIYVSKIDDANRKVRYVIPEDEREKCWVKKSSLGEKKNNTLEIGKDISECYRVNPEAIIFQKESGKTAEEMVIKLEGMETAHDEKKNLWYHINSGGVDGWIVESDTRIKKLSAFDWPGFKIAKEEGDTAYDPVIDFKNLSPFFKKIVDEINIDKDKSTISKEELTQALKNENIARKLSRLICFHQSEWWVDNEMNYYKPVFKRIGPHKEKRLRERLKNICWWDEVSSKVKGFPANPNVYHWNPVAFVENMKEINREPEWIVIAKGEIGTKEISGSKNNSRIIEYHKTTTLPESLYTDETAWCSSFVNWCFTKAGYKGTNSAWATDWKKWGRLFSKPVYGSVAIVDYGKDKNGKERGGHVGFVVGKTKEGKLLLLGGNQGKTGQGSVNEKPFGTTLIAGYVLPADFDFVDYNLPIKETSEEEGTFENTR